MNVTPDSLFYTKEHDWIRFAETAAFIGVSSFKLTGIARIDSINLLGFKAGDLIEQGGLMLHIHYKEYVIGVNAPISCTFLGVNPIIDNGAWDLITEDPEGKGWLFSVESRSYEKGHLLLPALYKARLPFAANIQP